MLQPLEGGGARCAASRAARAAPTVSTARSPHRAQCGDLVSLIFNLTGHKNAQSTQVSAPSPRGPVVAVPDGSLPMSVIAVAPHAPRHAPHGSACSRGPAAHGIASQPERHKQDPALARFLQVLAVVSTVFLPITFLAGVYGTNFTYLPEKDWCVKERLEALALGAS